MEVIVWTSQYYSGESLRLHFPPDRTWVKMNSQPTILMTVQYSQKANTSNWLHFINKSPKHQVSLCFYQIVFDPVSQCSFPGTTFCKLIICLHGGCSGRNGYFISKMDLSLLFTVSNIHTQNTFSSTVVNFLILNSTALFHGAHNSEWDIKRKMREWEETVPPISQCKATMWGQARLPVLSVVSRGIVSFTLSRSIPQNSNASLMFASSSIYSAVLKLPNLCPLHKRINWAGLEDFTAVTSLIDIGQCLNLRFSPANSKVS